jgi:hypothetical protein
MLGSTGIVSSDFCASQKMRVMLFNCLCRFGIFFHHITLHTPYFNAPKIYVQILSSLNLIHLIAFSLAVFPVCILFVCFDTLSCLLECPMPYLISLQKHVSC